MLCCAVRCAVLSVRWVSRCWIEQFRPVQVSLSNDSITLVASNAVDADVRLVLKQLHVQLMDTHGNFTSPGSHCECRVRTPV